MVFFDSTSFLVINELNQEIDKYEEQLQYYKEEYKKNDEFYKKLMNNKDEKEKYARAPKKNLKIKTKNRCCVYVKKNIASRVFFSNFQIFLHFL